MRTCQWSSAGWLLLVVAAATARADDWPQYRGPNRDDISQETGLLDQWPPGGPRLLWTFDQAGIGYSGVAVVGQRLYTIGGFGEREHLIALDLPDSPAGVPRNAWQAEVGLLFDFEGNSWSAGPSATPTVDGDRIYALGGNGDLICVAAADGKQLWHVNFPEELQAEINPIGGGPRKLGWGFTWSPLVDGDRLLCLPGGPQGTVAALDKHTGRVLWRSAELTDQAAYTSPVVAEIDGVRQCVVLTNQGLAGIGLEDGRLLWSYRRSPAFSTEVINSPIVSGNFVYVTVGAGRGSCDLLHVSRQGDRFAARLEYSNNNLTNHHGNVVLLDGFVYGNAQRRGWVCQELATGELMWSERARLRAGSMTYADQHFYLYGEDEADVVLLDASTSGWHESGRFAIPRQSQQRKPKGKIWTPPVVAGGRLFLRDQELLFCYDLRP